MADALTVTGLRELQATFGHIKSGTLPAVDGIVGRGAFNIKKGSAKRVRGLRHAPAYSRAIGYDQGHTLFTSYAQIGPDKNRRQGALGNLIEFGSVNNPPIPHLAPELALEAPKFERSIADAAAKMWARP